MVSCVSLDLSLVSATDTPEKLPNAAGKNWVAKPTATTLKSKQFQAASEPIQYLCACTCVHRCEVCVSVCGCVCTHVQVFVYVFALRTCVVAN